MLVMRLLEFSISSWLTIERLYFSKNFIIFKEFFHFFQVVHFISHVITLVVSYNLLHFYVVCCKFCIFVCNFIGLLLLYFFSWWVWLTVCLFYLSSQRANVDKALRILKYIRDFFLFLLSLFSSLVFIPRGWLHYQAGFSLLQSEPLHSKLALFWYVAFKKEKMALSWYLIVK